MSRAVEKVQSLPTVGRSAMALIEIEKRTPYEIARKLSELPRLRTADGELMGWIYQTKHPEREIEHYQRELDSMPDAGQLTLFRTRIAAALAVHTQKGIRQQVALMLGAFPNARPHDPEVYVTALVYDALDLGLPDAIVAQTCQHIRRTSVFAPAVSEFLKIADGIWAKWRHYLRCLDPIEERRQERIEAIETIREIMDEATMEKPAA